MLQRGERVGCFVWWDFNWAFHRVMISNAFSSVTTSRGPPGMRVSGSGVEELLESVIVAIKLMQVQFEFDF